MASFIPAHIGPENRARARAPALAEEQGDEDDDRDRYTQEVQQK
ncbi:hypothetical protein [Variovorax atrisoli]|nr:hypothetical protein [Variovorax paradoxus]